MANPRSALYTAARLMGDYKANVKTRGGHKIRSFLDKKTFLGVTQIEVGYYDDTKYPDGTAVRYVAFLNEFGSPSGPMGNPIPERPFFRRALNKARTDGKNGAILSATVDTTKSTLIDGNIGRTLGGIMVERVRHQIDTARQWAVPNAAYTIAQKGFDWPLVETQKLQESCKFRLTFGRYKNTLYRTPARAPNFRSLLYQVARTLGDVQAVINGNAMQRAGSRVYGKYSGRAIGAFTPATQGPAGRASRRFTGQIAGRLRP